jgi:hypothetical protein
MAKKTISTPDLSLNYEKEHLCGAILGRVAGIVMTIPWMNALVIWVTI